MPLEQFFFTFHSGYIPIKVPKRLLSFLLTFTFHSGYIPIMPIVQYHLDFKKALHSILDIFQSVDSAQISSLNQSLHSILDIFQFCRFLNVLKESILYIPFWIYSNQASFQPQKPLKGFTFHSGYIPIHLPSISTHLPFIFTFHSGYIPIRLLSYHLFTPFKTLFFVYLDFFYRQSMVFL